MGGINFKGNFSFNQIKRKTKFNQQGGLSFGAICTHEGRKKKVD